MEYKIFFLLILSFFILYVKGITVRFIVFGFYVYDDLYATLTDDFNKYSVNNELDIKLDMVLFSEKNMTAERDDYESTIDVLLKKQSTDYDLYVYDPIFTRRYASHFVDLKELYGQEYLDTFSYDGYQTSVYNNRWISLPLFIKYKVLYSNTIYLDKYKKPIPKTWDELIETGEYILKREREEYNNVDLVGYNGLFPNNENTICSIFEFIYSFRDTKESPFPEFNSQTAVDALNKIAEVKSRVSSDETFLSDEYYNMNILFEGKILFSDLWDGMVVPGYNLTHLPGKKEDVNGSCLGGFNMGISKYVSKEKIEAAATVLKFFTSDDEQKRLVLDFNVISSKKKIYKDEEFCKKVDCEFANTVQGYNRPSNNFENYELYAIKVIGIFNQFLFGDRSAKDVLTEIDNITRIHIFSIKDFDISLAMYIILFACLVLILIASSLLFIPKFKPYFQFLNYDVGIIYTVGSIFILVSGFTYFGEVKETKCLLRHYTLTLGFTMIFVPILLKLIINFPETNKISENIKSKKIIYILCTIIFEALVNLLLLISPFTIQDIDVEDGKNYSKCQYSNLGMVIVIAQLVVKALFYLLINFLIFLEWNVQETFHDLRALTIFMGIDWILCLVFIIFNTTNINNFLVSNIINIIILIIFSLSNHFYMFVIRILLIHLNKNKGEEEKMIDKLLQFNNQQTTNTEIITSSTAEAQISTIKSGKSDTKSDRTKATNDSRNYSHKLLSYHYSTGVNGSPNDKPTFL